MANTSAEIGVKDEPTQYRGVSLRFLSDFASKVPADLTTSQIVSQFIEPKCRGAPFVDLLAPKYVGPAQHYVIHAWSCCFLSDLVVPLLYHLIGDPNSDPVGRANALSNTYVWIDCFSCPLQPSPEAAAPAPEEAAPPEGGGGEAAGADGGRKGPLPALSRPQQLLDLSPRRAVVAGALRQVGSALLLLDSSGTALARTWCLYEVAQALVLRGPHFLHVPVFDFTLDVVYSSIRSINLGASEAHSPIDRCGLLAALSDQFKREAAAEEEAAAAANGPEAASAGGRSGSSTAVLRRSARLSGPLGAATQRIISGIQDALVGEAQQLIRSGVRSGPRYLSCLRKAAEALRLGKAPLAEALALAAVKEHVKALGETDAATLTALSNLALLRKSQGREAEAEELMRKVLAGRRSVLGRQHPDTAASCDQLAWLLQGGGKLEEAAELYGEALSISCAALGEHHPDTASSCNNLAGVLQALGRLEEAEPLLRKSLHATQRALGERHPHTATAYNNLGVLYRSRGDAAAARQNFEAAYRITLAVLGPEHADTATATANLALALMAEGRLTESEELLRQGLDGSEAYLGRSHPSVRQLLAALASVVKEQGRPEEAEEVFRLAVPGSPTVPQRGQPPAQLQHERPAKPQAQDAAAAAETTKPSPPRPLPLSDSETAPSAPPTIPQPPAPQPTTASAVASGGGKSRRSTAVPIYTAVPICTPPPGSQPSGISTGGQDLEPLSPGGMVGEWAKGLGYGATSASASAGGAPPLPSDPIPLSEVSEAALLVPPPPAACPGEVSPGVRAAAVTIQSHRRAYLARRRVVAMRRGAAAAAAAAAGVAGDQAKQDSQQQPLKRRAGDAGEEAAVASSRAAAATRIQAYHRGCLARRRVAEVRRSATAAPTATAGSGGPSPPVAAAMAGLTAAAAKLPSLSLPAALAPSPLPSPPPLPVAASVAPPPTPPYVYPPTLRGVSPRRPFSRNVAIVNAREALRRGSVSVNGSNAAPVPVPPPAPLLTSFSCGGPCPATTAGFVSYGSGGSGGNVADDVFRAPRHRSISEQPPRWGIAPVAALHDAACPPEGTLRSAAAGGGGGGSSSTHRALNGSVSGGSSSTNSSGGALRGGGGGPAPPHPFAAFNFTISPRSTGPSESHCAQIELGPAAAAAGVHVFPVPIPMHVPHAWVDVGAAGGGGSGSAATIVPLPAATPRADDLVDLHADLLGAALAQLRLTKARDNVLRSSLDSRAALQVKLELVRAAVDQALTAVGRPTEPPPPPLPALLPPLRNGSRSSGDGGGSSSSGDAGGCGGRGGSECGGPVLPRAGGLQCRASRSTSGEVADGVGGGDSVGGGRWAHGRSMWLQRNTPGISVASALSAAGAAGQPSSVREDDVQALMRELTELRALLLTTSSALSAAQRGLHQERATRKAMCAELDALQRKLSAATTAAGGAAVAVTNGPPSPGQGAAAPPPPSASAALLGRSPSLRQQHPGNGGGSGAALSPSAPRAAAVLVTGGGGGGANGGGGGIFRAGQGADLNLASAGPAAPRPISARKRPLPVDREGPLARQPSLVSQSPSPGAAAAVTTSLSSLSP